MKRKMLLKSEPVIAPEILEQAKRSLVTDNLRKPAKCSVCGADTSLGTRSIGAPLWTGNGTGTGARNSSAGELLTFLHSAIVSVELCSALRRWVRTQVSYQGRRFIIFVYKRRLLVLLRGEA